MANKKIKHAIDVLNRLTIADLADFDLADLEDAAAVNGAAPFTN